MSSHPFSTRAAAALALVGALALGVWAGWPDGHEGVAVLPAVPAAASAVIAAPAHLPSASNGPTTSAPSGPARAPEASPIGSEGYGPHIERARDGADPKSAWQAVGWLQACRTNAVNLQSYQLARDSGAVPEVMTRLLVEAQAEARRCQTVTTQHQALLPELALRALRGGIAGAAATYAADQRFEQADAALQAELRTAIRRDAQAGEHRTLIDAALSNEGWGLSYDERLSYLLAFGLLSPGGPQHLRALGQQGQIKMPAPNSAQMLAAQTAAQTIVNAAKARGSASP